MLKFTIMRIPKLLLAAIAVTAFFSFQSCKKNNDVTVPDPTPVIKPDTLTTGWTKVVLAGETGFGDIFFNSSTTGYLTGSKIYKSTDGGNTWLPVLTNSNLFNIFMTNDNKAFFVGQASAVLKTVDGGVNFIPFNMSATVYDIYFADNSIGFFIAQDGLYNTTDGGVTWVKLVTTGLPLAVSYSTLSFVNNTTGWVLVNGIIYKTNGSNLNWQQAIVNGGSGNSTFVSVYAVSASTIYATNYSGQVFRSTDGGANFSLLKQLDAVGFADVHFITDLIGYVSIGRNVYKTIDGGTNWTKVVSLGQGTLGELHFTDANHGWVCGDGGVVLVFKP